MMKLLRNPPNDFNRRLPVNCFDSPTATKPQTKCFNFSTSDIPKRRGKKMWLSLKSQTQTENNRLRRVHVGTICLPTAELQQSREISLLDAPDSGCQQAHRRPFVGSSGVSCFRVSHKPERRQSMQAGVCEKATWPTIERATTRLVSPLQPLDPKLRWHSRQPMTQWESSHPACFGSPLLLHSSSARLRDCNYWKENGHLETNKRMNESHESHCCTLLRQQRWLNRLGVGGSGGGSHAGSVTGFGRFRGQDGWHYSETSLHPQV